MTRWRGGTRGEEDDEAMSISSDTESGTDGRGGAPGGALGGGLLQAFITAQRLGVLADAALASDARAMGLQQPPVPNLSSDGALNPYLQG